MQALIVGGTEPLTVTLTWALSLLLNNRETLRKVQQELDEKVGRERQVRASDIKSLVYLQAVVKETLRLYPASSLSVPRESTVDCTVGGFHIPAGTRLLVNISRLHRDPSVWAEPDEFRPDRFLSARHGNLDVGGTCFELMPFGSGRRVCPGISFSMQVTHLALALLLHGFHVATPTDEAVDMRGSFGLTNVIATPLNVLLTPRLSAQAY